MNAPCYETSGAPIFSFVSYLVVEKSRVEVSLHLVRTHFAHKLDGAKRRFPRQVARARFAHKLDGANTVVSSRSSSCAFRARAR